MPDLPPHSFCPCFAEVFDRLRAILQEGTVDKRVQYVIESLMEARKKKFDVRIPSFAALLTPPPLRSHSSPSSLPLLPSNGTRCEQIRTPY